MARAAGPLPQGGAFVRGQGAMSSGTTSLTIDQSSSRGVIDWHSFSIGNGNTVAFNNGSGATLNRVTGGDLSLILGKLTATGSLYLINPQGILVGPSGVVSTGGRFVGSTLDICNCAFMSGGDALTLSGKSDASVINLGRISSSGGDVFLIARQAVINAGTVKAPTGTVELAAGETVLLQDSASSRQVFVQAGSHGTVVNEGRIKAAQISLQAADGNVYALAGGGTRVRATGTTTRDGHVWLIADSGLVTQQGKIAATNADGSGGTVDTQAAQLAFGKHAAVHAGQWNVSTPEWTIDDAAARTLQRSLGAGTSVDVTTTGGNGATGDLGIASSLRWQGPASLTLAGYRNVSVTTGTTIANEGAGDLTLRADASGIDNGVSVTNHGTIDWSASMGIVSALYDMTGSYNAGNILPNKAWTAPQDSGLITQVTGYKLVNSLADLEQIPLDLAGNYALGKDIDVSPPPGTVYKPIGMFPNPFTGQFDGMGHTISNLTILASSEISPEAGLFAVIDTAGVVRNLSVQGNVGGLNAGILAGVNLGTIAGAHTSGRVVGPVPVSLGGISTGGLVGFSGGTVTRSSSSADVVSPSGPSGFTGGLVGDNHGVIRQSFASGNVEATGATQFGVTSGGLVGGLVGYNNAGTITQSYATGTVSSPAQGVGALVGANMFGTIVQSFATGKVQAPGGGAGIAGSSEGTALIASDVFWDTQTTGANVAVLTVINGAETAAQGLTTAQMSTPSSFGPTYDFGPQGVWAIPPGGAHPVLRWQLAP
ncbi:filamentous hemagglutinin N-terminal domain-containing protein [Paraburkholderia kirstenboschensis]|uniref:Filamentous hemagglutinin N-terminal domain-containing protein n=1 Tax=Paraburkholderia kirstenboschensis TaxID=1245436 RepID=A0ABZ0EUM4_9BURK|nr:filamentous hemagglutinin N-terminal domain-containing protein [Paraburkholderia kirstenboschensis]WOD20869.1 filamentous hemagglutinin N-terminal domain-containing protein [Paraburkholderia kirstenboschensis]